jgi:hypothetical protein
MSELIGSLVDGYRRDLQRQEFFDLNAWCGLVPSNGFYRPESWEQIIRDLRQHGISRAVVSSAQCLEYDALQGNESIARLIADQCQILPCQWGLGYTISMKRSSKAL